MADELTLGRRGFDSYMIAAMPKPTRVDPGFVLKIATPSAKGSAVSPAWLARQFDRLRDRRVAVVHAQGGFGKTTLLVEWRRDLLRSRAFVGWLTIDQRDDPPRFRYGLIACLREATGSPPSAAAGARCIASSPVLALASRSPRPRGR